MYGEIECRVVDGRPLRRQEHDGVVGGVAGQRGQVVGTVDRGRVEDVVSARQQGHAHAGVGEALEFGGDGVDRAGRLRVRVEEVAGHDEEVDALGESELDRRAESRHLALPLRDSDRSEVAVSGPEVDVGGVEEAEHRRLRSSPASVRQVPCAQTGWAGPTRERGAPCGPRSQVEPRRLLCHLVRHTCDANRGTLEHPRRRGSRRPCPSGLRRWVVSRTGRAIDVAPAARRPARRQARRQARDAVVRCPAPPVRLAGSFRTRVAAPGLPPPPRPSSRSLLALAAATSSQRCPWEA